jgi:hypothetical protein
MLALSLAEADVRSFMNRLLRDDIFDGYEVRGVELIALTHIDIGGEIAGETESGRKYSAWPKLKPLVRAVLQNGEKPRMLKIIFSWASDKCAEIHPNAGALFINLLYENGGVTFTTATAQKQFTLDKTLDTAWDAHVIGFFNASGVNIINKEIFSPSAKTVS